MRLHRSETSESGGRWFESQRRVDSTGVPASNSNHSHHCVAKRGLDEAQGPSGWSFRRRVPLVDVRLVPRCPRTTRQGCATAFGSVTSSQDGRDELQFTPKQRLANGGCCRPSGTPASCLSRMAACGRVPVATNGCFVDAELERGRSERRAALQKPDGRVWVDCRSRSEGKAVIRLFSSTDLPTASAGRFVACADRPPPWTSLRAAS